MKIWWKFSVFAVLLIVLLAGPVSAHAQQACPQTYEVVSGDTLGEIAKECQVPFARLLVANPQIENPNRIFVGQEVTIPQAPDPERNPDRLQVLSELQIAPDQRWIDVDLSEQAVHAYQGDQVVRSFLASTGTWRYPTVTGQFQIYLKFVTDDMKGPGYDLKDVPYTMYFWVFGFNGSQAA